jgi:adenine specific DNA methylase Mod
MIFERLSFIYELLSEKGSLYVHCDWRLNSPLRLALDELFGTKNFQRGIVWRMRWISGYKTTAKFGMSC